MNIGFIGLGHMGAPMAMRLIANNHLLSVCDVNPDACAALTAKGAMVCATPAEVARQTDLIVTSLPGPEAVDLVLRGQEGVFAAIRPGALLVETSTLAPAHSRALSALCLQAKAEYIDAPVSNGVAAAVTGDLTIMVGGPAQAYEKALPVLRCMASHVFHMGPVGTGNVGKLINQMIYLTYVASFCEAARLGHEWDLDVPQLVDVLRNSVAGKPLITHWEQRLETGDLTPGFPIRRVLKDLQLCQEAFAEQDYTAPLFEIALNAFRKVGEAGFMESDLTALYVHGK
jgi:3-hydroxyisobutyrate dehydrogenase-like beta-hydroxyacid dehydrogenase